MPDQKATVGELSGGAKEDRLGVILEQTVYDWCSKRELDARSFKGLILEITRLLDRELFTGTARSNQEITSLALAQLNLQIDLILAATPRKAQTACRT